jgi:hypothetical protein
MMRLADRCGWIDVLWVLAFGLLSSAWCLTAAREIGPTFDEPFYLDGGMHFWRTGSFEPLLVKGTMPLPIAVSTLPVRLYELYRGSPIDLASEFDPALALARPGTLIFWWLLLIYAYVAGRSISGAWGGRFVVALVACEPTLLAHAALATTDLALAACLLAFAVHFCANRDADWRLRVGVCGLLYGVALLAKASTLLFGVLVMLTLEAALAWGRQAAVSGWAARIRACGAELLRRRFIADMTQIVAIGMVLTFVVCGSDRHTEPSFIAWAKTLPDNAVGRSLVWLSEHLAVFSNAGVAIVRQIKHNMQGHGSYLLGVTAPRSLWYFFPVALTIKLTLAMLLLPIVLALLSPRSLRSGMLALAVVFLAFSLTCRVQIGVRLVMPLIVFAAIGLGAALGDAIVRPGPSWRRRWVGGFAAVAVGWMALASAEVWPNGLCYINEAWGGTANAYECVSGSDNDWGQGLRDLDRWCDANGQSVSLVYYGCDPKAGTERFPRFSCDALQAVDEPCLHAALGSRDLAISVSLLYGPAGFTGRAKELIDFVRTRAPVARTQFFVLYRFGPSDAQAQNELRR